MSEYRLEMKGVVKTFPGVKALDHAQLQLKPGHVHALMGENGAGKSTLMKCMFGIYKMDEGEIYYEGEKVSFSPCPPAVWQKTSILAATPPRNSVPSRWWIMKKCMRTPPPC